ncbi:MAG: hypothetical protein A2076_16460 [Geobacteraceae bacterium GWC2_53_11]|nr:MAG: hypothetical protein A2076_16460 [Geobacteraceae bacterium GWC2_53_11]
MPWYENRHGEKLWYEDRGAGCPVVLVHGWCMSSAIWAYQFDDLPASMRLIAPDLRGHGRSREITANLDFGRFAEDLVDLFEALDLSQVVLVGWSMGAQVALQASAGLSGRLAGLVLVSATPRFTASAEFPHGLNDSEVRGMRLNVQRNPKRALDRFYSRLFTEGELERHDLAQEIKRLLSELVAPDTAAVLDALDALAGADMRNLLAAVSLPTVIVNGAQDRICLPEASLFLKTHITGAVQTLFPGCGHAPFLTHRHEFNDIIIGFVRSICGQNA